MERVRPAVKTARSVPYGQASHSETGENKLFDFLAAKTDHNAAKLQFCVYGYNGTNQMRGEYEQIA